MNINNEETIFWTDRRREIYNWLHEQYPSLAEIYEGAVRLMFDQKLPGRVRFISHAVREIRNRLPGEESKGSDNNQELKSLMEVWEKYNFALDRSALVSNSNSETNLPSSSSSDISIPKELFLRIQLFLKEQASSRNTGRDRAQRLFERCIPELQIAANTLSTSVDQWWRVTEWFMKQAHDNGRVDAECDEEELRSQFDEFENFLSTLSQRFYSNTDELDKILAETNI